MRTDELRALALTNYGHFTSMRVEDGRVRGLSLHLDRLVHDCKTLFGVDLDAERVREMCRRQVDSVGVFVLRVTVFDPELDMAHPGRDSAPDVLITTRPAAGLPAPPMAVRSVRYSRDVPAVKHVGLFGTIHLRRYVQLAGADDVLFLDGLSNVCEGATWNIGFIRNGEVIWPEGDCLPGVTMRLLQQAHGSRTAPVPLDAIQGMEAAFATNANVGVRVIRSIDGHELAGEHPMFDTLREAYAGIPTERL